MDAPDLRPEVSDPNLTEADPIGPSVLPKVPRYLVRKLALSGIAVGGPLAALVIANTNTGTTTPSY